MVFHAHTGSNIALSCGNTLAERRNAEQTCGNATLFSSKPLADEQLFEFQIRKKVTQWGRRGGLMIGLTAHNPVSVLPEHALKLSQSWLFYNGYTYVNGSWDIAVEQAYFDNLAVGSRVGVLRRASGALHLYINGVDQGSFIAAVPAGCFAVLELYGNCAAAGLIDTDTKGMVSLKLEPWQIPEFKNLMETSDPGFSISSDHVQLKVLPGLEWFLKVYPNGYKEADARVAVELCVEKSEKKSSATTPVGKFSISIASAQGNGYPRVFTPRIKFGQNAVCVVENFSAHEAIVKLCGEGTLVVSGEVLIEAPVLVHRHYLRELFESGSFSDFKIKVENEPMDFAVHRGILGTASPVMLRMFNSEYGKSKGNEMTIKQSSLDAVKAMLQFIYGDPLCFDNLEQLSVDVLKLADQYHLDELKGICEKSLIGMVSRENALQLAELGYLCNASDLKTAVSQFIFENKVIMSKDAWTDLEKRHPTLIVEILKFINSKLFKALSIK